MIKESIYYAHSTPTLSFRFLFAFSTDLDLYWCSIKLSLYLSMNLHKLNHFCLSLPEVKFSCQLNHDGHKLCIGIHKIENWENIALRTKRLYGEAIFFQIIFYFELIPSFDLKLILIQFKLHYIHSIIYYIIFIVIIFSKGRGGGKQNILIKQFNSLLISFFRAVNIFSWWKVEWGDKVGRNCRRLREWGWRLGGEEREFDNRMSLELSHITSILVLPN